MGASWRFEAGLTHSEDSSTLTTSFIERLNLTIRQGSAYLSRRTLSHARSEDKLEDHLELLRCHYNFVRPHGALQFGREVRTPAMQAGLATRRLTFREIFVGQPPSFISWDFRFARPGWPLYTPKGSAAHETLVRHSIVPLQRPSA